MIPSRPIAAWLASLDFREIELRVLAQGQSQFAYQCEHSLEEDPLFQKFVRAITLDARRHPENLRDARDVWDDEWADLLRGVSSGE